MPPQTPLSHNLNCRDGAELKKDYPDFSEKDFICHEALNSYRKKYLEKLLIKENKDINKLEKEVINAIHNNTLLSENIESEISSNLTIGQKLADKIAEFGGSWTFIITFFAFIVIWIIINIFSLFNKTFDPYPFILLNLILSCLASIQAPIIMMSQNRQEQKDRSRSENDYKINLKAELEIRLLNEKIDHLLIHQNKRLLDIQELQLDYLQELTMRKEKN
ncbi:MAG: DUF1003 domain-containing protein [Candidatus Sericytochromatia bacterium]